MKLTFLCAAITLSFSAAYPGEMYGTVSDEASKPLKGAIVVFRAADNKTEVARDTTNDSGSYRVFIKKPGACKVILLRDKTEIVGDAVIYPNPVRYNWIVEKKEAGLVLRRLQ